MPKTRSTKKTAPVKKTSIRRKRTTDAELVLEYVVLPEQEKQQLSFAEFLHQRKITSKVRLQKVKALMQQVVPAEVGQTEMQFLIGQMRQRSNLLELLKFPIDPEVQIVLRDLKIQMYKLTEFVKSLNDLGVDVDDKESIEQIQNLLKHLIGLMKAAVNAKDIRQVLNDMDLTKKRIEFLNQI